MVHAGRRPCSTVVLVACCAALLSVAPDATANTSIAFGPRLVHGYTLWGLALPPGGEGTLFVELTKNSRPGGLPTYEEYQWSGFKPAERATASWKRRTATMTVNSRGFKLRMSFRPHGHVYTDAHSHCLVQPGLFRGPFRLKADGRYFHTVRAQSVPGRLERTTAKSRRGVTCVPDVPRGVDSLDRPHRLHGRPLVTLGEQIGIDNDQREELSASAFLRRPGMTEYSQIQVLGKPGHVTMNGDATSATVTAFGPFAGGFSYSATRPDPAGACDPSGPRCTPGCGDWFTRGRAHGTLWANWDSLGRRAVVRDGARITAERDLYCG